MEAKDQVDVFHRLHPEIKWSQDDVAKLFKLMAAHVPSDDYYSFTTRAKKLPWDQIAFDNYTASECESMWNIISNKLRKFRLMSEMLTDAEFWLDHSWTKPGKIFKNHPDKPKRPLTAFQYFIKHGENTRKSPSEPFGDYIKKMHIAFENLPKEKKEEYEALVKLEKEEYARQMKEFLKDNPSEAVKKEKKMVTPVIEDTVKYSAFKLYLDETVPETQKTSDLPLDEIVSVCHKHWEEMTIEEKLPWFKKAKKQSGKSIKKKVPRKMNLYSYFVKKKILSGALQNVPTNIRLKELAVLWKNISTKDKEKLKQEYDEEFGTDDLDGSLNKSITKKAKHENDEEENYENEPEATKTKKKKAVPSLKTGPAKKKVKKEIDENKPSNLATVTEDSEDTGARPPKTSKKRKKGEEMDAAETAVVTETTKKETESNDHENTRPAKKNTKTKINNDINATSSPVVSKNAKGETNAKVDNNPRKMINDTDIKNIPSSPIISRKPKNQELGKSMDTSIESNDLNTSEEGSPIKKRKKHEILQSILARAPKPPPEEPKAVFKSEMKKLKIKYKTEAELSEAWSNLPSEERKKYKKLHKKQQADYAAEYEAFAISLSEKELLLYSKYQEIAL